MLFDILLVIMLIVTLSKSSRKGCTDDLNFSIAFLVMVRIAGAAYFPVSKIISNFVDNRQIAIYSAYAAVLIIVFYLYNAIVGQKIVESGKKIPKTTGTVTTYLFAIFRTLIIYSVIFSVAYTFPFVHRLNSKLITPKTQRIAEGMLGKGTNEILGELNRYLNTLSDPMQYFERQKSKRSDASGRRKEAVQEHKGLEDFLGKDEED